MGKLYLTKCQGPAEPQRFPESIRPLRVKIQFPTFLGCLGCALGECDLAGAYNPPLLLGKEEGCLLGTHRASFGSSVPVGAT